ncbi:ABC transporter permease [Clostridium thermarum]|uniref:ABC transporter permease n=1 Tax=Clostridium thermarum TaxID=1716543 RepID=UPI0013D11F05|nr:ABC transporter permease [Clostridium thermarum]
MQTKIFTRVFFGRKKFLILFFMVFSLAVLFINIQIMLTTNQSEQVATPDLTVSGRIDDDGIFRYKMYNDLPGFNEDLKEQVGEEEAAVYGLVCRNLMIKNNAFNRIAYSIFGVQDSFFSTVLSKYIDKGRLPEQGKKEIVLGSLAAKFYELSVGDKFNFPISLNKEIEMDNKTEYVVSGILSDNVEYFKGGVFISKETFESEYNKVDENMSLIYVSDRTSYDKVEKALQEISSQYGVGSIESFYSSNRSLKQSLILNITTMIAISLTFVLILLAFLLKGISKKIGLLKSLGILDTYIIKIFSIGIGIVSVLSTIIGLTGTYLLMGVLNRSVSDFLGYNVEKYKINNYVYMSSASLCILIFMAVFITIAVVSRRISPRDAMLKG